MTETIEMWLYTQNSYRWIGVFFTIYTHLYRLFLVVVVFLLINYTVASTIYNADTH